MIINIIPKKLYAWQKKFVDGMRRYNILVGPRQHGKTELIGELVKSVAYADNIKNPWINMCSDTQGRIKELYGERLSAIFGVHPDWKWPSKGETLVKIRRPQGDHFFINIFGSVQQPTAPEGRTAHFNVVDEAGYVDKRYIKESLMPTADETRGPTIIAGTVNPGDFYSLYSEARIKMKKPDSPWFAFDFMLGDKYSRECRTEKDIQEIKDRYNMDDPEERIQFEKMYMCNWFAGMSGTPFAAPYYQAERDGRIGKFPFDPNYKVGTCWDNGLGYKAIWFWQIIHFQPRFVGFMQWKDESLRKACYDIKKWYRLREAEQYIHIFPHTMKQREESDKIPLWEKGMDYLGWSGDYIKNGKAGNVDNKVDTSINVMGSCLFDEDSCQQGLLSLLKYRRNENKRTRVRTGKFIKDNYSHGAEAFTEFCTAWDNEELFYADDTRTHRGNDNIAGGAIQIISESKSILSPY